MFSISCEEQKTKKRKKNISFTIILIIIIIVFLFYSVCRCRCRCRSSSCQRHDCSGRHNSNRLGRRKVSGSTNNTVIRTSIVAETENGVLVTHRCCKARKSMSSQPSSPSLQRSKAQGNIGQASPTTSPVRDMRSQVLTSSAGNNAAVASTSPSSAGANGSPGSRQARSNSFFRKPSIRAVLTGSSSAALGSSASSSSLAGAGASGGGAAALGAAVGEKDVVPAADMSTPEALIAALQQVRLTAENLIRLGSYPKSLTLMWLAEFTTRGGLRALLEYMADYKRNNSEYANCFYVFFFFFFFCQFFFFFFFFFLPTFFLLLSFFQHRNAPADSSSMCALSRRLFET
jgi:hypothetical protein